MVSVLPVEPDNKIKLMREVVETAERNFGAEYFEKNKGHFWGKIETRPYMRAKMHLGELLLAQEKLAEAAAVFDRMLELNPNDNLGVRYIRLGLALALGDLERVRGLLAAYPDEEGLVAVFAWAKVIERFLAGEEAEAAKALSHARKVNRFAEPYLSGARRATEPPDRYSPGDESEALVCAESLALALHRHTGFQAWLRSRK
jgi:tetratricopeptide (TPR) repeat protein